MTAVLLILGGFFFALCGGMAASQSDSILAGIGMLIVSILCIAGGILMWVVREKRS